MACWTFGRYARFIVSPDGLEGPSVYFPMILLKVTGSMLDDTHVEN